MTELTSNGSLHIEPRIAELESRIKLLEEIVRYATSSGAWPIGITWPSGEPPKKINVVLREALDLTP